MRFSLASQNPRCKPSLLASMAISCLIPGSTGCDWGSNFLKYLWVVKFKLDFSGDPEAVSVKCLRKSWLPCLDRSAFSLPLHLAGRLMERQELSMLCEPVCC